MANPRNFRDEPVCPICARAFKPGDSVVRIDDCMIHVDCVDETERSEHLCTSVE